MNAPRRPLRRRVDGVLLLDKPGGLSSNSALQKARHLFNAAKAGHTGTLDPMATGLLPLCFGEATKFSGQMLEAEKSYVAQLRLGVTTDTADADGRELSVRPVQVDAARMEAVLEGFRGAISQIPPMHSALKRDGRPLYEYARQGMELERQPRLVTIASLRLLSFSGACAEIAVDCSKGTYIRVLAADIGEALGCGAHLTALRRTRIAFLDLAGAHTLDRLAAMECAARDALLAPPDMLLQDRPETRLDPDEARRLCLGQALGKPGLDPGKYRVYGPDGGFLGVGEVRGDEFLHPLRLTADAGNGVARP